MVLVQTRNFLAFIIKRNNAKKCITRHNKRSIELLKDERIATQRCLIELPVPVPNRIFTTLKYQGAVTETGKTFPLKNL
jgi:hypothetical protein